MGGTFNDQIFVDKLAKLNSSQQSIETLSHWCIFHRNKAKQVVETWERQFHCSRREKRVPFLYLANDILQNSRRKGLEFIGEFWRVLPDALKDVTENGDESERKAVLRMVNIWEERKVFGSRGQVLKEELLGRNQEKDNRNGKLTSYKSKQMNGDILEKLISSYEHVYDGSMNEDVLFGKCQTSINCVKKVEEECNSDFERLNGSGVLEELQRQQAILKECIDLLKVAESSRTTFLSHLKEAILEQEVKIEHIHQQFQAAQSQYEQAGNICQQLLGSKNSQAPNQKVKEPYPFPDVPSSLISEPPACTVAPITSSQQQAPVGESPPQTEEEQRKTTAAAVAAKLAASKDSAQMLSYVLSSFASEGVIGQSTKEDYPSDNKRPKLDSGATSPYIPEPLPQLPFLQSDVLHRQSLPQPSSLQPPQPMPPSSLPQMSIPPPPPAAAVEFIQSSAGSVTSMPPFSYAPAPLQRPAPIHSYPIVGMPFFPIAQNPHLNFQAPDSAALTHPPPPAALSPISQP